jgi:phosphatidylglycerophosphatase A
MGELTNNIVMAVATGFYAGKIPVAPGTFGSIVGLAFCYLLSRIDTGVAVIVLVVSVLLSCWVAGAAETMMGAKDPGAIVIDEIVGMGVTLVGIPFSWETAAGGFFLFRFFDILKPFPIRYLEKRLPGGLGIVADDVVAGMMATVVLRLLMVVFNS